MASLGLFGDDEAEVNAEPKEADVFKYKGKITEQDKPLEMPDTSESYEPQRLMKLLTQGKEMQELFAIEALPTTADTYGWQLAEPVATQLLTRLTHRMHDEEYTVAAARCVVDLAGLPVSTLSAAAAERCLLQPTLCAIDATLPREYICCEWVHALISLLPRLNRSALESSVLPYALKHGDNSISTPSRLLCCSLLGAVASAVGEGAFVERHVMMAALGFCQDIELHVRCCMCMQLTPLAVALGPALAGDRIASELIELLGDEHPSVRAEAYRAVVATAAHTAAHVAERTLIPSMVKNIVACVDTLGRLVQAEAALGSLAAPAPANSAGAAPDVVLGEVAAAVDALVACSVLPPAARSGSAAAAAAGAGSSKAGGAPGPMAGEAVAALDGLVRVASKAKSRELRRLAVGSLPPIARAWAALGCADKAATLASSCLATLSDDHDVRHELGAALLPLGRVIPRRDAAASILPVYLGLLKRASSAAGPGGSLKSSAGLAYRAELMALNPLDAMVEADDQDSRDIAGSASTIQLLRVASDLVAALSPSAPVDVSAGKVARDVLTALIALEGLAERRGLVMKAMLEQVGAVLQWLDPSTLYSHVLPLAIRVTASNSWQPHKRAAARIALCCARRLRTAAQRSEVCAWAAALASHPSFQMRLVFLDTLRQLISAAPPAGCSRQFLKTHGMLEAFFPLSIDKVANVRIQVCHLLLPVKRILTLPGDSVSLEQLYSAQRALKSDADVDVRLAMDIIDLQLSNVEVLRDALGARDGLSQSERAEAQDAERVAEEDAIMQAELDERIEKVKSSANEMVERARASRTTDHNYSSAPTSTTSSARVSRPAPKMTMRGAPAKATYGLGSRH